MPNISLSCTCGKVKGIVTHVDPSSGNRVVCYCDDCQAFARYLNRTNDILNENGGTDIYQCPPANVTITEGAEHIRCMRLTAKGLHRWYTECCKTPIGNTLTAGWPFIGLVHNFIGDEATRDAELGPIQGEVYAKFAKGPRAEELRNTRTPISLLVKTLLKVFIWKLKGLNKPSPVFNADGKPVSEPVILDVTNKSP